MSWCRNCQERTEHLDVVGGDLVCTECGEVKSPWWKKFEGERWSEK